MSDARQLIHRLAEEEDPDTDGTLEAVVAFYHDSDLAAEAMAVLCDWMDEENLTEELTVWMQEHGLIVEQVDEQIK